MRRTFWIFCENGFGNTAVIFNIINVGPLKSDGGGHQKNVGVTIKRMPCGFGNETAFYIRNYHGVVSTTFFDWRKWLTPFLYGGVELNPYPNSGVKIITISISKMIYPMYKRRIGCIIRFL